MAQEAAGGITILLVDDHVVVRQGLRMLLENHPDLVIAGEAGTVAEALEMAQRVKPEVVVLDLDLAGESGLDLIPSLTSAAVGARVLVLTGVRDTDVQRRAVLLGAAGVVRKDQAADSLVKALRRVQAGELWLDRDLTAAVVEEIRQKGGGAVDEHSGRIATLTPREREIVGLVAQGYGTQRIAQMLFISEKTVRNHLASIYEKLHVSERLELALYAARHGLVPPPKR